MPLDRGAIFDIAESGFKTTEIPVPSWGKEISVHIRELSSEEFRRIVRESGGATPTEAMARAMGYIYDVAVWCVVDDKGKNVFQPGDQSELEKKGKTASFVQGLIEIMNEVFELSGMTEATEEDEDQVEKK